MRDFVLNAVLHNIILAAIAILLGIVTLGTSKRK